MNYKSMTWIFPNKDPDLWEKKKQTEKNAMTNQSEFNKSIRIIHSELFFFINIWRLWVTKPLPRDFYLHPIEYTF